MLEWRLGMKMLSKRSPVTTTHCPMLCSASVRRSQHKRVSPFNYFVISTSIVEKFHVFPGHLSKLAVSLGAECRHRLDKTCTHYIYQVKKKQQKNDTYKVENAFLVHDANFCQQGKSTEAVRDKEVKMAKESGCFVVSPHWITAVSPPSPMHTSLLAISSIRYRQYFAVLWSYCRCFVVLQCYERGYRVHESDYPQTYNPNMALVKSMCR